MSAALPWLRAAVLLFLCTAGVAFQRDEGTPAREARPTERLLERWRMRPREERERMERHLTELEKLPREARQRLLERARALRERERSLERDVPEDLHQRLGVADPEGARLLWREHLRERFRARGRLLLERLPVDVRRRLEQVPPERRRRLLEKALGERDSLSRKALRRMCERHLLPAPEAERLEGLPLGERLDALREICRSSAERPG